MFEIGYRNDKNRSWHQNFAFWPPFWSGLLLFDDGDLLVLDESSSDSNCVGVRAIDTDEAFDESFWKLVRQLAIGGRTEYTALRDKSWKLGFWLFWKREEDATAALESALNWALMRSLELCDEANPPLLLLPTPPPLPPTRTPGLFLNWSKCLE